MSRAHAKVGEDALQFLAIRLVRGHGLDPAAIGDQLRQAGGDLAHRQDEIGEARGDNAARHRAVFGFLRVLRDDDAAGLLDRLDSDRAVRSRAGQDDGEIVAPLRGERAEKEVDRRPLPARFVEFGERQVPVGHEQLAVGRDDIDVPRFERGSTGHLGDRHLGAHREDGGQVALMLGVEMNDNHEGGVHPVGQALEELLQRMHAAGRCPDADSRKPPGARFGCASRAVGGCLSVAAHPSLLKAGAGDVFGPPPRLQARRSASRGRE